MATWPAAITQGPLVGTLEITQEPNVVEFKADVFSNMIRSRRYTGKAYMYNATMLLYTNAEQEALNDFFTNDCADGALPFDMVDWKTQVSAVFQWVQAPAFSHVCLGIWRVGIQLIKLPSGT